MTAKICIALALAVVFGALAIGNPFLPPRPGAKVPAPGVRPVSLRTGLVHAGERALPPCPEPALQALVAEVRFDATGEPLWILRDGRVLRRDGAPTPAGH